MSIAEYEAYFFGKKKKKPPNKKVTYLFYLARFSFFSGIYVL